jgi:hypothetical protein
LVANTDCSSDVAEHIFKLHARHSLLLVSDRGALFCLEHPEMFAWFAVLLSSFPLPDSTVSLAGDFGEPCVIVQAPDDLRFAHLSWPKVVKTSDGRLVVAYVAGRFHGTHGEGCPAVSISQDNGQTFSEPKILKEYAATDRYTSGGNVAMGVADDGAVVLLSMAFKGDSANTIDGWRLPQGENDWQPVDVSRLAENRTGSVYGHVFAIPEDKLAVVGHYRRGSTTETGGLWMSTSEDGGQSWGDPQTITKQKMVEPAFVYSQDRIIGLARPGQTPAWYTQLVSDDLGENWTITPKVLEPENATGVAYPSPGVFVDPKNPNRLFALVSQRFSAQAGNDLYGRIDLYTTDVQSLDWKPLGTLAKFPRSLGDRSDLTYGWMTPVGENRWYLVFYCGKHRGANDIYGLEFEMPSE